MGREKGGRGVGRKKGGRGLGRERGRQLRREGVESRGWKCELGGKGMGSASTITKELQRAW